MSHEMIAGICWGAAIVMFLAGGAFLGYREWLLEKLTTPSNAVSIHEDHDGSMIAVINFDKLWV